MQQESEPGAGQQAVDVVEALRLYAFANEVRTQAEGALWAFNGFHFAQQPSEPGAPNQQAPHLFKWLTIALVYSANVSKLFWGDKPAVAARRAPLRAHFGVTDTSPL